MRDSDKILLMKIKKKVIKKCLPYINKEILLKRKKNENLHVFIKVIEIEFHRIEFDAIFFQAIPIAVLPEHFGVEKPGSPTRHDPHFSRG